MHPQHLSIQQFSYTLPDNRIAWHPLEQRDESKLLIYNNKTISESQYAHIAHYLPQGSLLIFNNTRVVEARLIFKKPSGGSIEVFCLEPHHQYGDIQQAMLQKGQVLWNCLVGGASKWKHGMVLEKHIEMPSGGLTLRAAIVERQADSFSIQFTWSPEHLSFAEVLHEAGLIPLPPYIKRSTEDIDKERYQTIYARNEGSVAAPTAGLHFTDRIFEALKARQIKTDFVTLHVGAGTFKPVKAEQMQEHVMHTEFIDVQAEVIAALIAHRGKTFCVGTTSLRTLESLYWMGVKIIQNPQLETEELCIKQWEVYDSLPQDIPATEALQALLQWMELGNLRNLVNQTQILIAPGYRFRTIAGLITNFHQPQSTLLLLVAALIGEDWRSVYEYALDHEFRFLSYGDGCLLFNDQEGNPA